MLSFHLLNRRVRRASIFLALALTLVLTALPTAVMAAPAASHDRHSQQSCGGCYIVQRGDTLSQIAKWYGVSAKALAHYNGISNPSKIYVGQKLRIPQGHCGGCGNDDHYKQPDYGRHDGCGGCGSGHYIVRRGDTLSQIAKWNGVSVHYLAHRNRISNPSKIYVGQVIYIK
jgi:LysM repeat protein